MTGTDKIAIDLWTDVVCPWCYVGEGRLQEALEAEGLTDRFELRTHSFELDSSAPIDAGAATNVEHLEKKLGKSAEEVRQMESQIAALAEELGRDYATERPMANTRRIHRVMQALGDRGRDFFFELQRDYFTGTVNPFEDSAIVAEAVKHGMDRSDVEQVLADEDSFDHEVETDIMRAHAMGAQGVPFTVFDNRFSAPGALPVDVYRKVLRQLVDEQDGADKGQES